MNNEQRKILMRQLIMSYNRAIESGDEESAKSLEAAFEEQLELLRAGVKADKQNLGRSWSSEGDFGHVRSTGVILK